VTSSWSYRQSADCRSGRHRANVAAWRKRSAPVTILLPVTANAAAENALSFGYPNVQLPALFAQYVWFESLVPLQLTASDALRIH